MTPNTGDIEKHLQTYHGYKIYSPHLSPDDQRNITHALEKLKLPYDEKTQAVISSKSDYHQILIALVKEATLRGVVDYDSLWFQWIKQKISEFNYRYTRKKFRFGKDQNDNKMYKTLFTLYMKLYSETPIFNTIMEDTGKELDYFISAQYSVRCDKSKGILTPITLRTFLYSESVDNYVKFKSLNLCPSLIGKPHSYLFLDKLRYNKQAKQSLYLMDHESSSYTDFVVPVLKMKLPLFTNKNPQQLSMYLQSLELAIFRERSKKRHHNVFILSIEHLRTLTELYKKLANEATNE